MLYLLTITLDDLDGLRTTLSSLEKFSCDDDFIHIIKNGRINDESSSFVKSLLSSRNNIVLIEEVDSGIYDAMNQALSMVPVGEWFVFLNSGDCLQGHLKLHQQGICFLSNAFRFSKNMSPYLQESGNAMRIKKTYYDGMPFCHQALFIQKKSGMIFSTKYQISSDYLFVLRYVMPCFPSSPRAIPFNSCVKVGYDMDGISSRRKLRRDYESFQIVLRFLPFPAFVLYVTYRLFSLPKYILYKVAIDFK